MGKARRRAAPPPRAPVQREEKMDEPDPGAPVVTEEADDFHERRLEEAVLAALGSEEEEEEGPEEEEVLGLELSDDSEEEEEEEDDGGDDDDDGDDLDMDSDLEEQRGRGSGLPHELAWGQRKQFYYGTDYGKAPTRSKAAKQSKEEAEAEELEEEEEAKAIQKRLAQGLGEDDFGLDLLQAYSTKAEQLNEKESGQKIAKDLESLSKKEQLKLLKKESPELLELIQDFEAKLTELKDELEPLMQMVKDGVIPEGKGSKYLQTKYHLYLNYCCNISFYLVLKAKRIPIHGHPVIERLVSYRNLINDLGIVDQKLSADVRLLLKEFHTNDLGALEGRKKMPVKKIKPKTVHKLSSAKVAGQHIEESDTDEQAALNYYKKMEEMLKLKRKRKAEEKESLEEQAMEEEALDQKRGATYQILKNKGLTPKRKKIDRNPRVKHREKFRRAKIRRKGQVQEVRREEQRYGGELSGIRAGVKKSVKLK